jgi:glycosyltransferase involved in cell wall biosynthesis
MKILFVLTMPLNKNGGGVQMTTYKLGKYFTDTGFDVCYYSFSKDGHKGNEYAGTCLSAPNLNKNKDKENIENFKKVIVESLPDIVINQMPYESEIVDAIWDAKQGGHEFKILTCLRNTLMTFLNNIDDIFYRKYGKLSAFMFPLKLIAKYQHKIKHAKQLQKVIDCSDKFILLAPTNKRDLKYFLPAFDESKVDAIPNSVPSIHPEAINLKEKTILSLGNINIPHKRADLIVPFWLKIKDLLPDWKMVVVGDGEYLEKLKIEIKCKQLERITLTGRQVPDSFYTKASFFVMFSAFEGFPNTLVEAQSFACPVAAFNTFSSLEYVVRNGEDGFVLEPFDLDKMVQKVYEACSDENKLKTMMNSSLENAERFVIRKVGVQWKTLFDNFLTPK